MQVHLPIRAAVFDFDGTISTLRCGWEGIMRPLMLEVLRPTEGERATCEKVVDEYIDRSTGVQTLFQMRWLREQVVTRHGEAAACDEWAYKDEYNKRLMEMVAARVEHLQRGADPEEYRIAGSFAFLSRLRARGILLCVASGTDEADVQREVNTLGLTDFFAHVQGAPHRRTECAKEAALKKLLTERELIGAEIAVIGDGPVEIRLGREAGALTVGVASNEVARRGVNAVKWERLHGAGAEYVIGDFLDIDAELSRRFGLDVK